MLHLYNLGNVPSLVLCLEQTHLLGAGVVFFLFGKVWWETKLFHLPLQLICTSLYKGDSVVNDCHVIIM